jgi:hypothetical protein
LFAIAADHQCGFLFLLFLFHAQFEPRSIANTSA